MNTRISRTLLFSLFITQTIALIPAANCTADDQATPLIFAETFSG